MQTTKQRILCVGDDEDDCSILTSAFEELRFEVKTVKTVAEGLSLAKGEQFDLYLLSKRLPNRSGVDLCQQIREFDLQTPILFLAETNKEADWRGAKSVGAQGYLLRLNTINDLEGIDALVGLVSGLINQIKKTTEPF